MATNPQDKNLSEIQNVTQEECFDRWKGQYWYNTSGDKGTCGSDYDFDGWIEQHEQEQEEK
jgi:hypothetical protein